MSVSLSVSTPFAPKNVLALLDRSAQEEAPLPVRFALLVLAAARSAPDAVIAQNTARQMSERLKVPADCRELAQLTVRVADRVQQSGTADAPELLALLEMCDTLRRPERFECLLQACALGAQMQNPGLQWRLAFSHLRLAARTRAEVAVQGISEKALASGLQGPAVGAYLRSATLQAISEKIRNH
jgi:tRNA nucleotidyltransferase (CCA-adding enzyme)